jgi:hypothetical protein
VFVEINGRDATPDWPVGRRAIRALGSDVPCFGHRFIVWVRATEPEQDPD